MSKTEHIVLNEERVSQKVSEIRAATNKLNFRADNVYDQTIRNVNSPACLIAETIIESIASLRRKLGKVIYLNRVFTIISMCTIITGGILWTLWVFLAGVGLLITTNIISRRQTTLNIEIACRTEVFWEMMNSDKDYCSRVLEFARLNLGSGATEHLQSFMLDIK